MATNRPKLTFLRGGTYTFDVSAPLLATHPFKFTADSGATEYTTGVTLTGTQGQAGASLSITVSDSAPNNLNYYCGDHGLSKGNHIMIPDPIPIPPDSDGDFVASAFRTHLDVTAGAGTLYSGDSGTVYFWSVDEGVPAVNDSDGTFFTDSDITISIDSDYLYGGGHDLVFNIEASTYWYGNRAVSFGFQSPSDIQYFDITTPGNASQFGDITGVYSYSAGAAGNSQYAVVAGNKDDDNSMTADCQYVTVSTLGNAQNWGDLVVRTREPAGAQHATRIIWFPGTDPSLTYVYNNDRIQYLDLASQGNGADFGNTTVPRAAASACGDGTRAYMANGYSWSGSGTRYDTIDVVTVDNIGNSTDFGDAGRTGNSGGSMGTDFRWLTFGGTSNGSSNGGTSTMHYYPVGATGTSAVFGYQLSSTGYGQRGVTNNARGVIVGQTDPNTDVLQYIEVATLGNAVDFGDMIAAGGNKVSSSGSAA